MTPNHDRHDDDPVLAALSDLPAWDVSKPRALRLGARCRAGLARQRRSADGGAGAVRARWPRLAAIALLAAWCAVYTAEVLRRGAAAWGL